jgi:hypothetical protein
VDTTREATPTRPRPGARGRAGLLWAVLCFLGLQAALSAALWARVSPLPDPEYTHKLRLLRARLAEGPPGRALVLLLGSSRTGVGFRPEALPRLRPGGAEPLVFNFALCATGPTGELLCLRRLLADGIRPDWVLLEAWPAALGREGGCDAERVEPHRLRWGEQRLLGRSPFTARALAWWQGQVMPWYAYRFLLMDRLAPSWLPAEKRTLLEATWHGLDRSGWLSVPAYRSAGRAAEWRLRVERTLTDYAPCCKDFHPSDANAAPLRQALALCRREHIRAVLVLMPDGFDGATAPAARAATDDFLRGLGREAGAPVLCVRDWLAPTDFFEGVHPVHPGAAAFSKRFGREALAPLLEGRPVACQLR